MTILFRVKTDEGYNIKTCIELLQNIVKTCCFDLSKDGICIRTMDSQQRILVNINLPRENFRIYELETPMQVGFNLNQLYKMIKVIKKKDSLVLYIDSDEPDKLYFVSNPRENSRVMKSCVHIQSIQQLNINLDCEYAPPVVFSTIDYQKTLKDLATISDSLLIQIRKYSVVFSASVEDVYSREVQFGETDDNSPIEYCEVFEIDPFIRTFKIASLNKSMKISKGGNDIPILLKACIGDIGDICIYIKSKEHLRNENL